MDQMFHIHLEYYYMHLNRRWLSATEQLQTLITEYEETF